MSTFHASKLPSRAATQRDRTRAKPRRRGRIAFLVPGIAELLIPGTGNLGTAWRRRAREPYSTIVGDSSAALTTAGYSAAQASTPRAPDADQIGRA